MSDYTPTTDGVRDTYVRAHRTAVARLEFDRWLAQEHKKAAAAAMAEEQKRITELLRDKYCDEHGVVVCDVEELCSDVIGEKHDE